MKPIYPSFPCRSLTPPRKQDPETGGWEPVALMLQNRSTGEIQKRSTYVRQIAGRKIN